MNDEFELTFLVKALPDGFDPANAESREILDIYLPSSAELAILRIRKNGDSYEITKKTTASGTDSSHLNENTIPLTEGEYGELSTLPGKRVRKIRYCHTGHGIRYEIDVFQDSLAGLVLADVEFSSDDAKARFVRPEWLLADVTQEKVIAGGSLCGKSYDDIGGFLEKYSYRSILI